MDTIERTPPTRNDEAERSLVEQAAEMFRPGSEPERDDSAPEVYPDGYVRVSPPQTYRTPEGYYRGLAVKAALYSVAALMLLALCLALVRNGILRF